MNDNTIVVWTLRNINDGRVIHVTRTIFDPYPEDVDWEIDDVDYIYVAGGE